MISMHHDVEEIGKELRKEWKQVNIVTSENLPVESLFEQIGITIYVMTLNE